MAIRDRVLRNVLRDYAQKNELAELDESDQFESFVANAILRHYHGLSPDEIETSVLVGGGSGDGGLDAVAVLVNGQPVRCIPDVDMKLGQDSSAEFVLIQAKTSPNFRTADIGTFGFGIRQFFAANRDYFSGDIAERLEVANYILDNIHTDPKCSLYYVTTGKWRKNREPEAIVGDLESHLEADGFIVDFKPIDVDQIKKINTILELGVKKTVTIDAVADLRDDLLGVEDGCIGLISGREFINLVSTDDNELNRNLFYSNVRDFQGRKNPVNKLIDETLQDSERRDWFPLLNNGVTILANKIYRLRGGKRFELSDFQIVNGCQTTCMLFENREIFEEDSSSHKIQIPIKILVTQNSDLIDDVITATNRQTQVSSIMLESLHTFHKDLELHYLYFSNDLDSSSRIYYERRKRQYHHRADVSDGQIITVEMQIKSFVAMFLDSPHEFGRDAQALLDGHRGELFNDSNGNAHQTDPYYASGVAYRAVNKWLKINRPKGSKNQDYLPYMLMQLRVQISGKKIGSLTDKKVVQYSEKIVAVLQHPENSHRAIKNALESIEKAEHDYRRLNSSRNPWDNMPEFTSFLIDDSPGPRVETRVQTKAKDPMQDNMKVGEIVMFDFWRGFGFIRPVSGGDDVFIHKNRIDVPIERIVKGTYVKYNLVPDTHRRGRLMASDVILYR